MICKCSISEARWSSVCSKDKNEVTMEALSSAMERGGMRMEMKTKNSQAMANYLI
jgi:hypothetical protein